VSDSPTQDAEAVAGRKALILAAGLEWCEEHQAPRWFGKWTCLLRHDDEQARIAREWRERTHG
jgi:hypothetical protein